jgi:hypothetical protein
MNAAEKIQAAIERLEELRDGSTPGPRFVCDANGGDPIEYGPLWVISHEDMSTNRTDGEAPEDWFMELSCGRKEDAELIVTLHRTIDAQLAILRHDLAILPKYEIEGLRARWERAITDAGDLDLATAIMGNFA